MLALGANLSVSADSHLVAIQQEDGSYQTQAINIQHQVSGTSHLSVSQLSPVSGTKADRRQLCGLQWSSEVLSEPDCQELHRGGRVDGAGDAGPHDKHPEDLQEHGGPHHRLRTGGR